MSLDYDRAYAAAREGSPFSNSTEYDYWAARWCDRCERDVDMRTGDGPGCPLLLVGLMGRTPAEWQPTGLRIPIVDGGDPGANGIHDYVCAEFLPDGKP